jgi:hypothetical protein
MDEIDLLKGFRDDMPEPTTDAWLRARAAIAAARAESGPKRTRSPMTVRWFRPLYGVTLAIVALVSAAAGAFLTQAPTTANPTVLVPLTSPSPTLLTKVAAAIHGDANYMVYTQSTTTLSDGLVYTGAWWDYPWTGQVGSTVRQTGTKWVGGSAISWSLSFVVPPTSRLSAGNDTECQLTPHGITVNYTNRTWQSAPPPCVTLPPGLDMLVPLQIIGHPVVDNQRTTELQQVTRSQTFTFWISDNTYLPLQSQTTRKQWTEQEQYSYSPAAPDNVAKLTLTIPKAYNQTLSQTPVQRPAS